MPAVPPPVGERAANDDVSITIDLMHAVARGSARLLPMAPRPRPPGTIVDAIAALAAA